MNRECINDWEGIGLVILFISGGALAMQTAPQAGGDIGIAILLAIAAAIPVLLVYSRILSLYPGKDLFDILQAIFGKTMGKGVSLFFIWFAFFLGSLVIRNMGDFPVTLSIPETPIAIPMGMMTFLCVWIVREGIEVMGRWATLFVLLNAPLPTAIILMLIPQMDINNILPVFYNGIRPVLRGAFSAFSFPFTEIVVFTMALLTLPSKKSPYRIYLIGLFMAGIMIVGVSVTEMLVLGEGIYQASFFPNHSAASEVQVAEIIQRMEVVTILATMTAGFLKISVCLLSVSKGISKFFSFPDYRFLVLPVGLLMYSVAFFIQESVLENVALAKVFPYYTFPFAVILPIIVWLAAEWKRHQQQKSRSF
ncbi:MAG: GerAB/ArcD/ProY family transporter [Bacillota bacterium]